MVIASRDPRFTKLARFLLDGRGIAVTATIPLDRLLEELSDSGGVDVVLIDAADELADALRASGAVTARHPEATVVMVGEGAVERAPAAVRIFDKFAETDEIMAAVETAVDASGEVPSRAPV